ncbi:MAG: NUDIX domain-containing protein [Aureispira sp.]|nr:NUDIX domain-containing protein [Aureispira sp.]
MQTVHEGVGLLITNAEHSLFYLQVKDETYPAAQWRGAYSFWGGAIDLEDSSPAAAVKRELEEELPETLEWLLPIPRKEIKTYQIEHEQSFPLTFFVAIVSNEQLELLGQQTPAEGYGRLVERTQLFENDWIWGLEIVIQDYLNNL